MIWFLIGVFVGLMIGCCFNISGRESEAEIRRGNRARIKPIEDNISEIDKEELKNIFHEKEKL